MRWWPFRKRAVPPEIAFLEGVRGDEARDVMVDLTTGLCRSGLTCLVGFGGLHFVDPAGQEVIRVSEAPDHLDAISVTVRLPRLEHFLHSTGAVQESLMTLLAQRAPVWSRTDCAQFLSELDHALSGT